MLGQRSKDAISQMILRSILPTAFQWLTVLEVSMWLAIRLAAISLARQVGRLMRRVRALATIGDGVLRAGVESLPNDRSRVGRLGKQSAITPKRSRAPAMHTAYYLDTIECVHGW